MKLCTCVIEVELGDNCIQNFHLGRYIVGYTVGNLVLRRRASGAVKRDFRRIFNNIPPQMKILNMVIPILMHICSSDSNRSAESRIKAHKAARHPRKCDLINDVKLFPAVYRKFLTLSNQTSRNISKCIRMAIEFYPQHSDALLERLPKASIASILK